MIFKIFNNAISHSLSRSLILKMKHNQLANKLVPMINEWNQKDNIFQLSRISLIGEDSIKLIGNEAKSMNLKRALIVTDETLIKIGLHIVVIESLNNNNIEHVLFQGVKPNPSLFVVNEIKKVYIQEHCDFIISLGGGSAHDSAKAAGSLIYNSKTLEKYQGLNTLKHHMVPMLAVNTTAGTGSEVTNVAVITDPKKHVKMTLVDKHMMCHININDPRLMTSVPLNTTAYTGIDALTHALESYLSPISNPISDAFALQALKLIYENLELATRDLKDVKIREKLAYGEYLAGVAFNQTSLGSIHAISHQLTALYNIPHGLANAVLLPYVEKFNCKSSKTVEKFKDVSKIMELKEINLDKDSIATNCLRALIELNKNLNLPYTLKELDVKPKDFPLIAKLAMQDFTGLSNPIQLSKKDIINILEDAYNGKF